MVLTDRDLRDPRPAARFDPDPPGHAKRDKRDVPVPAPVAGGLAQHVAMRHRVVLRDIGHRKGLRRRPRPRRGRGGVKGDRDLVLARNGQSGKVDPVAAKGVLRPDRLAPVHPHRADAVEPRQHEVRLRPLERDGPRHRPFPFGDPAQPVFVPPEIRVRDQPCGMQRCDPVTGHLHRAGMLTQPVLQHPWPRQVDPRRPRFFRHNLTSVLRSKSEARSGLIPTVSRSPCRTRACPSIRTRKVCGPI